MSSLPELLACRSRAGHAGGIGVLHSPFAGQRVNKERDRTGPAKSAVLLGVVLVLSFLPAQPVRSAVLPESGHRLLVVEFTYFDSHARKVSVVGSFNQWSPDAHVMERSGDRWSLEVELPPGRYEYAFLIDDRVWKSDPGSLVNERSGFGPSNSILIVE
jgi:hypothetical protein